MDPQRWRRIQELFHRAADLPDAERRALLAAECADDPAVAAEVLALLEEDGRESPVLDAGVARAAHALLEPPAPGAPVESFGPYRIRHVLGEGGMGVVYLAEREDLGSLAAVKILRDAWLSPARRERFAAEQRTLAQLSHPSIARLLDAGALADGTPWFVMEYVQGVPLSTYCAERRLTIAERLHLFRDVCEAVLHAHQHAVIHRDIKPSNILVTADGQPKLLDFGIAKQLESVDGGSDQTRTALRLMTPAYAAPEQLRGSRVGVHTDVYSLGVVLFELLTTRLPFDLANRTPSEVEALIVEHEAPRPSVVAATRAARLGPDAGVPTASRREWADLDVLCLTAMRKDPARRYRSVDAFIRDVDHYLRGEPLEARADTLSYRLGKFVRRHRHAVGAAAAAVVAIAAITTVYTMRLAAARNAAVAEAARTQRIQRFTLSLFDAQDPDAGPADSLRVLTLVDRGLREARALDAEPLVQAELFQTLGGIYRQLGQLARADTLLRAALDRRRAILPADHPDVARSQVALAALRADEARYAEAEELAREALALSRRTLPPDHPEVVRATTALGHLLEERGRYDDAIALFQQGIEAQPASASASPELASLLYGLVNNHIYVGHYAVADSLGRQVLAMNRALHGDRHPSVADDLTNLGVIQHEQGYYADAEAYHQQALDIRRAWYGEDHHTTAYSLTMIGRARVQVGKSEEAVEPLRRALEIRERIYGPWHPMVASTLNELGNIAVTRDQLDEARAHFDRVLAIYRRTYGESHSTVATALSNLASVDLSRQDHVAAERGFRAAVAMYAATLSPTHRNTAIARIKLGRSLLRQRRFADAARESLAGYEILVKESEPAISFLQAARRDLAAAYDALGDAATAERFRQEEEAVRLKQ